MSRIGKQPIIIPSGVKVEIQGTKLRVVGKNGMLERDIRPEIEIKISENSLECIPKNQSKTIMAFWGLTRTLINNMIVGVEKGFTKKLLVEGVGYRVNLADSTLSLNVGYSSTVDFKLPDGVSATVDKDNSILLNCIDKELLGLTAARIRDIRKPEPYKGKGIRYVNEHIVRKIGKAGGKK